MQDSFDNILPKSNDYNEDNIIDAIRQRVSYMLEIQPDLLMSYLYRLDVLETDLKRVLNQNKEGDIIDDFTHLIWNRQKQRLETKAKYKQPPIEGWEY